MTPGKLVRGREEAARILSGLKTIAVVGASRRPGKAAHDIPAYLAAQGYEVIPVNPSGGVILGVEAYPSLSGIPADKARRLDAVLVFRPSEEAGKVIAEAERPMLEYGRPRVIWFQPGTEDLEKALEAVNKGFTVVIENCAWEAHLHTSSQSRGPIG